MLHQITRALALVTAWNEWKKKYWEEGGAYRFSISIVHKMYFFRHVKNDVVLIDAVRRRAFHL